MKHLTRSQFAKLDITDFISAKESELLATVREGMRLLNPMLNTLYRHGVEDTDSPIAKDAYKSVMDSGGLFNTVREEPRKGPDRGKITYQKTRNELLKELAREIDFIQSKSATLEGARRVRDERAEIVKSQISPEEWARLSIKEQNKLVADAWDDFHRRIEESDLIASGFSQWATEKKTRIIDIFNEGGHDPEAFHAKIEELKGVYNEEQRRKMLKILEESGVSTDFFTL